jgi:hypothetical protein
MYLCTNYDIHGHDVQSFESPVFHRKFCSIYVYLPNISTTTRNQKIEILMY